MNRDLLPRVASSIVLVAIAAGAIWIGGFVAACVVAAIAAVVHAEWSAVTEGSAGPALPFTVAVALAMLAFGGGFAVFAPAIAIAALAAAAIRGPRPWRPLGVLYAVAFGLSLLMLRASPDMGVLAVAFVVAVVAATDIGAYVAGRAIGGPKLWPAVSPNKTWSGALGGLAAGLAGGIVCMLVAGLPVNGPIVAVTAVLSVVSQGGDLFESHVKRRFGAKDSGRLLPGHGGMMDRVDGLVFASVVAVLIGLANGGAANPGRGLLIW